MKEIKYTIYKLIDPITNETRYIGLTFNDLKQRLRSHCSEKSKSHKSNWIQKLKSQGLKPIIESIEQDISSYDDVCEREIYWIEKFKSDGHKLTNMASGGNKNKKMSEETRKKMSESQIERNKIHKKVNSKSTRLRISNSSDINMNLISEYDNIRKASLETGISDSSIRNVCNKKRNLAGGFIWKYKNETDI